MKLLFVLFLLRYVIGAAHELIWREEFTTECEYMKFNRIFKSNDAIFVVGHDLCGNGFLHKRDLDGTELYTTTVSSEEGYSVVEFFGISLDNSGNPWVAGSSDGPLVDLPSIGEQDSLLISFNDDNNGSPIKTTRLGVDNAYSMASDVIVLDNNVVIAGAVAGETIDHFADTSHCFGNKNSELFGTDVYVAKYGTNHQFIKGCQFDFAGQDLLQIKMIWTGKYFYVAYYNDTVVNLARLDKNIELVGSGFNWRTYLDPIAFDGVRSMSYFPYFGDVILVGESIAGTTLTSHVVKIKEDDMRISWQKDFTVETDTDILAVTGYGKKAYLVGYDSINPIIIDVSGSYNSFLVNEEFRWDNELDQVYDLFADDKGDLYLCGEEYQGNAFVIRYKVATIGVDSKLIWYIGGASIVVGSVFFTFVLIWCTKKGGANKMKETYYNFTSQWSTNRWTDAQGATIGSNSRAGSKKSKKSHKSHHHKSVATTISSGASSDTSSMLSQSELSVNSAGGMQMDNFDVASQSPTMSLGSYDRSRSKSPKRKHKSRSHSRGSHGSHHSRKSSRGSQRSRSRSGKRGGSSMSNSLSDPYSS